MWWPRGLCGSRNRRQNSQGMGGDVNQDEIIAMANAAAARHGHTYEPEPADGTVEFLASFAALVAAKAAADEREALCDVDWTALMRQGGLVTWADAGELGDRVIEVLRARGEKEGA